MQCRARIGSDGGQQAQRVIGEDALLRGALHADHTDGALARFDRHAQIRKRFLAHKCCADLRPAFIEILIDEQRLAGLDDLAGQPFAEGKRFERLAKLIWEVDQIRLRD